ncbi:uncharacterized protein LOC120358333 [Solenopsis invicta]|uniref:uncharacterized protein LOC120358333 n=1 Tax=Solenopsis invicta TaxID=13686 RepID=UPI00193E39BC|nr:uncharacterized protein LOC120358333 [Solenopsis invicta]
MKCRFNKNFFKLFTKFMADKLDLQRHEAFLINEMSTCKSISVKSTNLTYKGLVDFGEDNHPTNLNEKADHGLVIMFKLFADVYIQPIAVFASRGPVTGYVLTQLVVKAISLVKNAGAKVHAVITDGASTNRNFWENIGVSGKRKGLKNYFLHPMVKDRKVFVFSDTPHFIKTIRNRLANNSQLKMDPNGLFIKWEHFHILQKEDSKLVLTLRVCNKLTNNHITLKCSDKMRVFLAVQVY